MAVNSKTDICNLASDLLSASIVSDIDNPSDANEAIFERWYDQSRKKALREHPWNFAAKRLIIAASSTAPAFGYTVAFPMPNDFIRLLTIESDDGVQILTDSYQFESGNVLLSSDATSLRLRYIYDIEDVSKFDAMFVDYLALTLALSVAYKITQSGGVVERINQLLQQHGAMAKAVSGMERVPTRIQRSRTRAARMGNGINVSHRIIF